MSQKDSSSRIKAQGGGKRSGTTKYRIQAVQAQEEVRAAAAKLERKAHEAPVEPDSFDEGDVPQEEESPSGVWQSRVLASYKDNPKDSQILMARIPAGKASVESGNFQTSNVQEAMIGMIDRMFDLLQNSAYEFNKKVNGTDLELNWIRPFLAKEQAGAWSGKDNIVLVFSGRLSTRLWTMVVKGTEEDVLVYILPTDKLIGFALSHTEFKCFLRMKPVVDGADVRWQVLGHVLEPDQHKLMTRVLFDSLVRHAQGKAKPDEAFSLEQIGLKTSEKPKDKSSVEEDTQKKYQEAFFADMRERAERSRSEFLQAPAQNQQRSSSGAFTGSVGVDGLNRQTAPNAMPPAQQPPMQQYSQQQQQYPGQQMYPGQQQQYPSQPQYYPQQPQDQQQMYPGMPQPQHPGMPQQQPQAQHPGIAPPPPNMMQQGMMPQPNMVPPQQQRQMPPQQQQPMSRSQQQMPPHQMPPQQGMSPQQQQMMQQQQMAQQQYSGGTPAPQTQAGQPAAGAAQMSFPAALSQMLATLDRELAVVAKAGADAFAQRDLIRADAALKFSGRLTEFRTLAHELLEYYKRRS